MSGLKRDKSRQRKHLERISECFFCADHLSEGKYTVFLCQSFDGAPLDGEEMAI